MNTASVSSGITDTIGKWLGIGKKKEEQKPEASPQFPKDEVEIGKEQNQQVETPPQHPKDEVDANEKQEQQVETQPQPSQENEVPPKPPNDPKDLFYSDGINTPLEVALLPFADLRSSYDIINSSKMKNEKKQFLYQGELTYKNDPDNYEVIEYNIKGDKEGNVLVKGRYGTVEFKEEYKPDGVFSGKLEHFVKDKSTGEYVKDGDIAFRDLSQDLWGDYKLKGNMAGIPVEENFKNELVKSEHSGYSNHYDLLQNYTIQGKVGDLDTSTKTEGMCINVSKFDQDGSGHICGNEFSERYIAYESEGYCISKRSIGDFNLKTKRSMIVEQETEQPK